MRSTDSFTDTAYEYIRDLIVSRKLDIGAPITEESMIKELNMSRTPIRNAFKRLEDNGFITIVQFKGARVADITIDDVIEVADLRIPIERWVLSKSINEIPLEKLDAVEAELKRTTEEQDWLEHSAADKKLHGLMVEYSHSKRAEKILDLFIAQIDWYRNGGSPVTDIEVSLREHMAIIESIRERNIEKADAALVYHLLEAKKRWVTNYNK